MLAASTSTETIADKIASTMNVMICRGKTTMQPQLSEMLDMNAMGLHHIVIKMWFIYVHETNEMTQNVKKFWDIFSYSFLAYFQR